MRSGVQTEAFFNFDHTLQNALALVGSMTSLVLRVNFQVQIIYDKSVCSVIVEGIVFALIKYIKYDKH